MEDRGEEQHQPSLAHLWRKIQGDNDWEGLIDPFDPILKSEILRYGDFVYVCYRAIENDRILSDRTLLEESENLQHCGYKIRDYIYAKVQSSTSWFTREKTDETVWIGFIAVCIDETEIRRLGRRDIVVAFRGTDTPREWIHGLDHKVVPWQYSPGPAKPDVRIHKVLWDFYSDQGYARDILKSCITELLKEHEGQELSITVTGHSMGAALAIMSAYDIKLLHPSMLVTVFAFDSPRVGNQVFADHMKEIGVKVLRVVVKGDLTTKMSGLSLKKETISKILRKPAFYHVGIKFPLDPNDSKPRDKHFYERGLNSFLYSLYIIDGYQGSKQPLLSSERGKKYLAAVTSKNYLDRASSSK